MPFEMKPEGIFKDDRLICAPLEVVAYTRDRFSENWGRFLRFKDPDGKQKEWSMPMQMFARPQDAVLPLLSAGLTITPGCSRAVLEYIQSASPLTRITCVNRTGWQGNSFVLPDRVIQAEATEQMVYQASSPVQHKYRVAGTEEDWRVHVGSLCEGNSRLLLAVSCAFAGPVLRLLGEESGGIHIYGASSLGKTTAALVAGSVLGGGERDGYTESWLSTANGLEGSAALHNDTCLILDELKQVDPKLIIDVIYMIANGQGKGRQNAEGGLRERPTWALTLISNGELTLQQHANAGGDKVRGGVMVRVLDIPLDAGKKMGLFEDSHGSASALEFSRVLKENSRTYYGAPLHAWLERLVRERDACIDLLREEIAEFERVYCPVAESPEVRRAGHRFAIYAAAGEVATKLGLTGWSPGSASSGCARCMESWMALRGGSGSFDAEEQLRQLRHFLQAHGDSRFQPWPTSNCRSMAPLIRDCAGYRRDGHYLFHTEVFRKEVCQGYDHIQICRLLSERGYLTHPPDRFEKQFHNPKLPGSTQGKMRFYAVKGSILED
jgi:putative DNA primase/helicase